MKTLYSLFAALLVLLSACTNGNKSGNVNSEELVETSAEQTDISQASESEDSIWDEKTTVLMSKLERKEKLTDAEFQHLCYLLLKDTSVDESFGEGFGNSIFQYFRSNSENARSFGVYLDQNQSSDKERILKEMVFIMCIDIGEEKYSYDRFIEDFELFNNSASAQESFDRCIANWVD